MRKRDEAILKRRDGCHVHGYVPEIASSFVKGEVSRREFLRTVTLLGVGAGAGLAFVRRVSADPGEPPAGARETTPVYGGTLRFAMEVPDISDPAVYDWAQKSNVARWIVEYLTRTRPDNVTVPYLAQSWEASDDLRTWTFALRRGVTWSNGDDFTADDVLHNFRRWLDPGVGSPNMGLFSGLTEVVETTDDTGDRVRRRRMREGAVERIDSHTIRLHLDRPNLAVPENLYNYPTAIVHRRFEEMGGNLAEAPVGTGPYTLDRYEPGKEARLVRRDGYWGEAPYLDAIHYVDTGEDRSAMMAALASGQVDGVHEVDVAQLDVLQAMPGVDIHSVRTARTGVCRMRVDSPPFDDRRVREAITVSLDHPALLERGYRGRGSPAENHHVGRMHPEYARLPWRERDTEKARHLLAEAGYDDGLKVAIDVGNTEGPWELATVQAMREQLAPAGIELDINAMSASDYWEIWRRTPFGLTSWTHRPLGVMALNLGYRSGQAWNETQYANPEFDAALDEANGQLDPDDRRMTMERVQAILQGDHVIAQPFWRNQYVATRDYVKGFRTHPAQYHQFQNVWLAS